jgi:uncharacterized repeat protein (TIGR03803 family)
LTGFHVPASFDPKCGETVMTRNISFLAATVLTAALMPWVPTRAASFSKLYTFASPGGRNPNGSLIVVGGMLVGTTSQGGSTSCGKKGCGTVFSIDLSTNAETTYPVQLSSKTGFAPTGNVFPDGDSWIITTLFGGADCQGTAACGTAAAFTPPSGDTSVLHSFGQSGDAVDVLGFVTASSVLYGTSVGGGSNKYGAIFSLDPAVAGSEKVLYSFAGSGDGVAPSSTPIMANGILYGTTSNGGTGGCALPGCGTVFQYNIGSGKESILYSFKGGTDGQTPTGAIVYGSGSVFGTTQYGCVNTACGRIYEVNVTTGVETILYSFPGGATGGQPRGGVIEQDGVLYGTTTASEGSSATVFSFDLANGTLKTLYTFKKGPGPVGALTYFGGSLYGAATTSKSLSHIKHLIDIAFGASA